MFLPENNFKFVNISVVTFKDKNTNEMFEIACFPNKLFEYFKVKTYAFLEKNKNEILQSEIIFKNITRGEESNKEYLILDKIKDIIEKNKRNDVQTSFSKNFTNFEEINDFKTIQLLDHHLICIKYILDNGYERKGKETAKVEIDRLEREIINMLKDKLTYFGYVFRTEKLKELVKKHHIINPIVSSQKQVGEVMKKLEKLKGIERYKYKITFYNNAEFDKNSDNINNDNLKTIVLPSDKIPEFIQNYKEDGFEYFMEKVEAESEEIC